MSPNSDNLKMNYYPQFADVKIEAKGPRLYNWQGMDLEFRLSFLPLKLGYTLGHLLPLSLPSLSGYVYQVIDDELDRGSQNYRDWLDGALTNTLELRKLKPRKERQFVQGNPVGHL